MTATSFSVSGQRVVVVGAARSGVAAAELLVRDLDMDLLREVRNRWQFYRDRRPDAYGDLVRP